MIKELGYYLKKPLIRTRTKIQFMLDRHPIMVYQMGKVGSSTVYNSLKSQIRDRSIYHFHSVHRSVREHYEDYNRDLLKSGDVQNTIDGIPFLEEMSKRISAGKERLDFITLVREPLSRNISAFFQGAYRWIPNFEADCLQGNIDVEKLIDFFFSKEEYYHRGPEWIDWLDREIKGHLDIDVFATKFPKDKGFETYTEKENRLLLMRAEDLAKMDQPIRSFLRLPQFQLQNANESTEKYYAEVYRKFKKSIRAPEAFIDDLHRNKFSTHFYTKRELEAVKEQFVE